MNLGVVRELSPDRPTYSHHVISPQALDERYTRLDNEHPSTIIERVDKK